MENAELIELQQDRGRSRQISMLCSKHIIVELFAMLDEFFDLKDQPINQVDLL
jgi:hypothetical protein